MNTEERQRLTVIEQQNKALKIQIERLMLQVNYSTKFIDRLRGALLFIERTVWLFILLSAGLGWLFNLFFSHWQ